MTPVLNSITGNLLGQLLNTKLKASNSKILSLLDTKLGFLDLNKLNLNEASALFTFDNGQVKLKPLIINYKDIGIQIGGTHGFDQTINYDVKFDIPVKYLGSEVTNLLAKLTPKDAESLATIPVTANLTGNFSNPTIKTDLEKATSKLVTDLIEKQKQSLLDKGKDKLTDLLTGGDKTKKDSTKTKDDTKDKIKNVLNGLLNKNKKKTDTVN